MKWELILPQKGDIIRVCVADFHHYGIYVSDDEIIQFGLSPVRNVGLKECDIRVLSSDIETFLNGGFLEVAVLDWVEKKSRLSVDETVRRAREKLGEGGYSLLHNNCEHFVNYCVFDKGSSVDADRVKGKPNVLNVYTASVVNNGKIKAVVPKERETEIRNCTNKDVKREKYYVWKLLEYAFMHTFNKKLKKLGLRKTYCGKWVCDGYEFSLSHSSGAVAVAVSDVSVGVDIERKRQIREGLADKILTNSEKEEYGVVSEEQRNEWLMRKWTQKESVFKTLNLKACPISAINTDGVKTLEVKVGDADYYLSVCSESIDKMCLFENINL